jgi:hypothetical protein
MARATSSASTLCSAAGFTHEKNRSYAPGELAAAQPRHKKTPNELQRSGFWFSEK